MSNMLKFKILIIEDDIDLNELLVLKLKSSGYEVISLADFFGVEDLLDNEQIDLLIVDRNLPSGDSLEKIQDLREQGYKEAVIFLTAKHIFAVLSFLLASSAASHGRFYPEFIYLLAYIRDIISGVKSHILYFKSELSDLCFQSLYIRLNIICVSRCHIHIGDYVVFAVYCSVIKIKES